TFSRPGLADNIEVAAALLGAKHDKFTRNQGTEAKLLVGHSHGRKGAGVPCAPRLGIGAGSTHLPNGSARATWRRCHCAWVARAAGPAAHCRLNPTTIVSRSWSCWIVPRCP